MKKIMMLAVMGLAISLLSWSCNLLTFPAELQGRWEWEDDWYFEWFIIESSELHYNRIRKPGTIKIKDSKSLTALDVNGGRFVTQDRYYRFRWENNKLFLMFNTGDYPDPAGQWKEVHPY